jgi:serine protease Do
MRSLLLSFTLAVSPLVAAPATIELNQGGSVKGELLSESAEKVVIDLGFTVLSVPRDAITRILKEETKPAPAAEYNLDLFRTDPNARTQAVKDHVNAIGDRVVLIKTPSGLGSGFIIHPDGYLITNDHVVAGENEVTVTVFGSGTERQTYKNIRILATSADLDLALLKIETPDKKQFPTVPLGDADDIKQGQPVFAIGAPLGLERSVSEGIISLRNRPEGASLFIQTTTQINPGNSGGPLFNLRGEVIGVNNMKIVQTGAEGLGFAIPATTLKNFLKNRDTYAFDAANPNAGFRYNKPPGSVAPVPTPALAPAPAPAPAPAVKP